MSLSKQLTLFIGLMALGTTSAWAACTRLSQYGEPGYGRGQGCGSARSAGGLGDCLRDWTMSAPGGASYSCTGTNRCGEDVLPVRPIWAIKSIPPTCPVSACV
jgi:hypothetical protein